MKILKNYLVTFFDERREKKLTASRSCSSKELAVVGPKPCSLSKAANSASLLFPYSVLTDIAGVLVASDIILAGFACCSNFCSASSLDCPEIFKSEKFNSKASRAILFSIGTSLLTLQLLVGNIFVK